MLTETDIHYLVGILSTVSHPDNVEVELGSQVLDAATDECRDVDVTVRIKDQEAGEITAFKGIEVKKLGRKLDSTHIEQLATKLNDMPSISHRAIVSASGYYSPAIRKANAHGIELFELCDWNPSKDQFEHFKGELQHFTQTSLEWVSSQHVQFNPTQKVAAEIQAQFKGDAPIYSAAGQIAPETPTLNHLVNNLRSQVQHNVFEQLKDQPHALGVVKHVNAQVNIADTPYLKLSSGKFVLEQAKFTGAVTWVETKKETHFKVLKKLDDDKPYAGCVIGELGTWGLVGLMVSRMNRDLRIIHVPVSDRNKRKIFKQRIA